MASKAEYINRTRSAMRRLMTVLDELKGISAENTAMSYGSSLVDGDFTAADSNDDLTAAQFQAGITAVDATRAAMVSGGYDTDIYELRK